MKDFSNGLDDEPTQDWTRADWEAVYDRDHDPWNGYAAPKWEPPTKINRIKEKDSEGRKDIEVWKCPQHGPTCNPGICKERARVERDRRWEEERKKREDDKKKRQEERERNRLKKERKLARAEGREPEVTYDPPPHFGNHQRWGSNDSDSDSSSTSNDSDRDGSRNQGALITTERTKTRHDQTPQQVPTRAPRVVSPPTRREAQTRTTGREAGHIGMTRMKGLLG
jgi:hypothetical protein